MSSTTLTDTFFKAVSKGDLPIIQECVKNYVDVNISFGHNEYLAFEIAISNKNVAVVKYLSDLVDINHFSQKTKCPPIFLAVSSGHKDIIQLILKKKPNLNITDYWKETPLLLAISKNLYDINIVKMLFEAGADINFEHPRTPLVHAVGRNNLYIVKELVELGADVNKSGQFGHPPLLAAVSQNNLGLVKYLVGKGANVNAVHTDGSTCLSLAVEKAYLNIANYLIGICKLQPALFLAAKHGHLSTVKYLLSQVDIHVDNTDTNGNTALTVAIKHGQEEVANFLIKCKADLCKFVPSGQSPLSAAVETKNISLINKLLDHGALIYTGFYKAIKIGNLEIVKLFAEKGANLNLKFPDGSFPITIAANSQYIDIIKFLIEQGADVNQVDAYGQSVLSIAASKSSVQIVKFLLSCNADVKLAETNLQKLASWHYDVWFLLEEHISKMLPAHLKGSGTDAYEA